MYWPGLPSVSEVKVNDHSLLKIKFDLKSAAAGLHGKVFDSFGALRVEIGKIKIKHVYQMPYEFTTVHLFNLMKRNGWVEELRGGSYRVHIGE